MVAVPCRGPLPVDGVRPRAKRVLARRPRSRQLACSPTQPCLPGCQVLATWRGVSSCRRTPPSGGPGRVRGLRFWVMPAGSHTAHRYRVRGTPNRRRPVKVAQRLLGHTHLSYFGRSPGDGRPSQDLSSSTDSCWVTRPHPLRVDVADPGCLACQTFRRGRTWRIAKHCVRAA